MTHLLLDTACVLLIAEDATLLETLSQAIRSQLSQLSVVPCLSIPAAIQQFEVINFDAIVLDSRLLDGNELQRLAKIHQHREIPVLLLASYAEQQIAEQALQQGAYDLIHRPIQWRYFVRSLSSAILARQISRLETAFISQPAYLDQSRLLVGLKILVVEDDPDNRDMQSTVLNNCGAVVMAVESVQAALAAFEYFEPDVLVSDIRLPVEDGYSLIRKLRRRAASNGGRIPAIAVTAYAQEEERRVALGAGYHLHLAKPIQPETLIFAIAALSGRMEAEEEVSPT